MSKRSSEFREAKPSRAGPLPEGALENTPALAGRKVATVIVLTAAVWLLNAWWLAQDTRPPAWDMATHQSYALNYVGGRHADPAGVPAGQMSGAYPPFVHWIMALVFAAGGPSSDLAPLVNLPATLLLFWAIYELGDRFAGRSAAMWSSVLAAGIPYLVWMSRETILDYWLAAWVAAGLAVLLRTRAFNHLPASLALGVTLALGLLTKWTYPLYLLFPCIIVAVRERIWRSKEQSRNAAVTAVAAIAIAGTWYLPRLPALLRHFAENAGIGALEGEPEVLSFQSFVYYLRLLEGYQLFALLFVFAGVSWIVVLRKSPGRGFPLLASAIAASWLGLTLIRTKDPRFSMPLLPLLAVAPGVWIAAWEAGWKARACKICLSLLLCLQVYLTNVGVSWLPDEVVLLRGYQGSLQWDWQLYSQHYFHILGPPRREDWKQEEILRGVDADAEATGLRRSLGVVPDLARFSAANFHLCARLHALPIRVYRMLITERGILPLEEVDYALTTDGSQGMSWTTVSADRLARLIPESGAFRLVDRFPLPDGSRASLYAVVRARNKA